MGTAFLYGNGGGIDNLKFRVYSATSLPASGKENDVVIITSTPIPSWEVGRVDNPSWSMTAGFVYLTCAASDASQPNLLRKNALYLELTRCWQYENGAWSSKDAYQYRGGQWVQFSTTFTATINITYPAGSTCRVTDGTTTLTAPNTSGTWACVVPNAGTWTVAIESLGRSVDVVITDNGQSESVSLSYVFLYDKGDQCTGLTGNWKFQQANDAFGASGTGKANSDNLSISTPSNNTVAGAWRTNNKIDLTNYRTLHVTFSEIKTDTTFSSMCISVKQTLNTADNPTTNMLRAEPLTSLLDTNHYPKFTAPHTAVLDVSALSGDYYIIWGVSKSNSRMAVSTTRVTEVYLT